MIRYVRGNLFDSDAHALVNTVNCVGVMGKGIAYQFQRAYPAMYKDYQVRCRRGEVRLGAMTWFEEAGRLIINFPTKGHWKANSKLEDVQAGLVALRALLDEKAVTSVAVPPLGCGNGGLDWRSVRPLIDAELGTLTGVDIEVFEPAGAFEAAVAQEPRVSLSHFVLAALRSGLARPNKLNLQKAAYFFNVYLGREYFEFVRHKYGPYDVALDPMTRTIKDYLDYRKLTPAEMVEDGLHRRLAGPESDRLRAWLPAIQLVTAFANRHPDDLEALATVHAVVASLPRASEATVVEAFFAWSKEKAERFNAGDVRAALAELVREGLVEETLLGLGLSEAWRGAPTRVEAMVPMSVAEGARAAAEREGRRFDDLVADALVAYVASSTGEPATRRARG